MARKASGETCFCDNAKEKKLLKKLDEFLSFNGGKHPSIQILELWATQFNSEFSGVPIYGLTLYLKTKRADEENI